MNQTLEFLKIDYIEICEVGPRDGLQNEKKMLTVNQKIELIEESIAAGAKVIEIGSFVHPKMLPQMADTDRVALGLKTYKDVEYRALVMNLKGIERAEACGIKKVKLGVSASRMHSMSNLNKTPEEALSAFEDLANFAEKKGMVMAGAISTAFGYFGDGMIPVEALYPIIEGYLSIGVNELSLSDTTGVANPKQVYTYARIVREKYPQVDWSLHFHNTRGMGLANVVAGMQAGVMKYDSCFAGIGGCPFAPRASGNIATEDLVHMVKGMGIRTDYDLDKMIVLARKVQTYIGRDVPSFMLKSGELL